MAGSFQRLGCQFMRAAGQSERANQGNALSSTGDTPRLTTVSAQGRLFLTSPASEKDPALVSSGSPFFERLPPEIRQKIYRFAFGNKVINLDLQYNYIAWWRGLERIHAPRNIRRPVLTHHGWVWWSCVCPRYPPQEFLYDDLHPIGGECHSRPRGPGHMFLGVLGWFLTCRQSYIDTVDLLYSANTVHVVATVIHHELPRFFPYQRLTNVTWLEVVWKPKPKYWDLRVYPFHQANLNHAGQEFQQAFNSFHINYPCLESFHLFFDFPCLTNSSPHEAAGRFGETILTALDSMVEDYDGQLKFCMISIPDPLESLFERHHLICNADKKRLPGSMLGYSIKWRIWRIVNSKDTESPRAMGYWIQNKMWEANYQPFFQGSLF